VIIVSNLTFEHHIKALELKMSRAVGIICKLKTMLLKEILLKLYYALVHPHLLYRLLVWGSTYPSYLKKINTLQNKAVKHIGGGKYYDRAKPFYSEFYILKLPDLYKLEVSKLI